MNLIKVFLLAIIYYLIMIKHGFAYIDPGPIASFWAIIGSFFISILVFIKIKWLDFKNVFIKLINNKKKENDKK